MTPALQTAPEPRDIALMVCLSLEGQPLAIHAFDEDAATVEAMDSIAAVDVSDLNQPVVITTSGARFRIHITRES